MTSTSMASYAHEVLQAPLIGSFFSLLWDLNVLFQVAVIWILETIQSGLTISFNNTYLIRGFGNMSVLSHIAWNLVVYTTQSFMSSSDWLMVPKVSCQVGLVVIFLVNMYFTWRVWKCKWLWFRKLKPEHPA
ncbi:hypothetical protein V8B97DRAFT_1491912 [Scleroderma yunnanense]